MNVIYVSRSISHHSHVILDNCLKTIITVEYTVRIFADSDIQGAPNVSLFITLSTANQIS